jgi:hypothetical protein
VTTGERKVALEQERDQILAHIQQAQQQFEAMKNRLNQIVGKLELLAEIESQEGQGEV